MVCHEIVRQQYPLEAVPVPGQPSQVVYEYVGDPTAEEVAFVESRQWPQPEGADLQDPDFATAIHTGRVALAAGSVIDMAAVQQEALKSYTKHQATIHSRFQWLKDPANELTRAEDTEDGILDASWELSGIRQLECSAAAMLQRCLGHGTGQTVGHGISGWMAHAMGIWTAGGTTLRFCLMKHPDDVLFEQPSRAVSACDHGWSENISALLHAAGIAEDDQASRLRACVLPGSYTIGLEVLLDGEHAADITPSQVMAARATLLQGAYYDWDESIDGGMSLNFEMVVDTEFRIGVNVLDQLGLPRGSLLKIEWQLGGEPLCTTHLRGITWSAQSDRAGGPATLIKAMRKAAATAMGAEPNQMQLWLRYRPAAALADADSSGSGSASSTQPPAASGAAGRVLLHDGGVAGILDVGALCGGQLVELTPEQVYRFLPQLRHATLSAGWRLASRDSAEIDAVALRRYWGHAILIPGPIAVMLGLRDGTVVRLVANDRVIVEARATKYALNEITLTSGGRAAGLALLDYLDSSEDVDKVVVMFKAGAMLPGGVLELSLTFIADGKAITWHEAELDAVLADLDSKWEADNDGQGLTRRCISRNSKNDEPRALRQVYVPASMVESLQLSGATSCTASFSSSPGSPTVELRIFRRSESGSVVIDAGRLHSQMRSAFQVLRDGGQHVQSVHIAADPSTAAAAGSPPHLSFAYLDAAGMTLTIDDAGIEVCPIKGGWVLPDEPTHCARRPVDELPTKKYLYFLRLPGHVERQLRLPGCEVRVQCQLSSDAADVWTEGTLLYDKSRPSGTCFRMGEHNIRHVIQAARVAAAALAPAAGGSGPGRDGSGDGRGSGCWLQLQHASDWWLQHRPDLLLSPIPQRDISAAITAKLASMPPSRASGGVCRAELPRVLGRGKLAPGGVPQGMQQPLQPIRLVISLLDGSGQPVAGFSRAAVEAAQREAAAQANYKRRSEAEVLGAPEPLGERRTRRRRAA